MLRRGIHKSYIKREEDLDSPHGRINIGKLCRQGGLLKEKLSCKYFAREENDILNKTLLAGLKLGLQLVLDAELKIRLQRLCSILEEKIENIPLTRETLRLARNSMNRLTYRYAAVLEIINILYESQGIQLEDESQSVKLKGYFFDMKAFFETLVGKLLEDFADGYAVKDQYRLHDMFIYTPGFNPQRRRTHIPRPDFAMMQNGKVVKLMDAKYRDLWEKPLPREMLYQLAVYAMSGVGDRTATILYPATSDVPSTQKIAIKDPVTNAKIGCVILKPLNLMKVADLLPSKAGLREYVNSIMD